MTQKQLKKFRVLLALVALLIPLSALAQSRFIIEPAAEEYPQNTTIVETATMFFGQNYTNLEYGTRIDQPSALALHRLDCSSGQSALASIPQNVWSGGPFTTVNKVGLKVGFRPKGDFVGALTITFFARTPGSTTDLFTKSVTVSIGSMPPPLMNYPIPNENLSPAPAFQGALTSIYPQLVMYQIEMVGPTNRTITIPLQSTGTLFTSFTPEASGYQPGIYTWRTRTLDARGKAGPWSNQIQNTLYGGLDMAGSASTTFLNTMRAAGWNTFFTAAWGGRNIWTAAATNLTRANNAGYKVAAYAFLNFDNGSTIAGAPANQTGQWQVDQGLRAIGYVNNKASLPYDLKYFMIDLENAFQGTMAPQDRVQRVAEAVQHVRNLGFWPMIYTRNEGFNLWWNQYTNSSTDFRELWLWDSKPQLVTHVYKDHLTLSNSAAWTPYGGWEVRGGKQHLLDQTIAGGNVDFSVWNPAVWEGVNSPNPGFINITPADVTVIRNADNTYKVTVTLRNTGNIEAYAIRLGDSQLGTQLLTGRQTLGMITPNGSRMGVYTFPATSGAPGTFAQLQFTVWTGNGPQNHSVMVNLP